MRQDESTDEEKSSLMAIISPIYFIIFVLSTQFVLVNLVVAVLLKKLEVSLEEISISFYKSLLQDSAKKIEDEQRSLLTTNESSTT